MILSGEIKEVKDILLTGSTGFLGQILLNRLSEEYTVATSATNNADYNIDLRNQKTSFETNFNTVIHCAGKAHSVPRNDAEAKEFHKVNFNGTKNLCHILEQSKSIPANFIFISTVAVYGVEEGQGITEDHPLEGRTPYAQSKILAENYLQKWASENNVRLTILRLPLVAGNNPPGNLGAMIKGIKIGRYFGIGKSNARKSMVWVDDVARIIPKVALIGGIYNLTDGYHPTFGEIEDCIAKSFKKRRPPHIPVTIAKLIAKAGDLIGARAPINTLKLHKMMSSLIFDDSKARELLHWDPSPVLERLSSAIEN